MQFNIAKEKFFDYLLTERDCSNNTIRRYNRILYVFDSYVDKKVEDITLIDCREYIVNVRKAKNYKTSTVRSIIHCLSSFFKFCYQMDYTNNNVMKSIRAPKEEKIIPYYLPPSKVKEIFELPKKHSRFSKNVTRDKLILETLFLTGGRISEISRLDFNDVDFGNNTIKFRKTKNKEERLVPLIDPLKTDLWNYLIDFRMPLKEEKAIFLGDFGKRLTISGMKSLIRRYAYYAELPDFSAHKARHTYATELALNDVTLLQLKDLLGHKDIKSTTVYAKSNIQKLQEKAKILEGLYGK